MDSETPATGVPDAPNSRAGSPSPTRVRRDVRDLRPRDVIDLQSFIRVQGSDEYAE